MIHVLFGPNRYGLNQRLKELRDAFVLKYGADGVEGVAGELLDVQELSSLVTGVTLFATHRLVIINSLAQNKPVAERFAELLSSIPDEITVIMVEAQLDKRTSFYKSLQKQASLEVFAELDERTATAWVQDYVTQEGGSIDSSTARYLVESVGLDQMRLKKELEKLVVYEPVVTTEVIDALVEKTPQQLVFQLLEHAFTGRLQQALTLLDEMERAHEDPFQLMNMLIWQTHILALVASAREVSDSVVAKEAKLNPFVIQKTRSLLMRSGGGKLKAIIEAVAVADHTLKSSSVNPWRTLEITLTKIAYI